MLMIVKSTGVEAEEEEVGGEVMGDVAGLSRPFLRFIFLQLAAQSFSSLFDS